jgi:hypothetical protein
MPAGVPADEAFEIFNRLLMTSPSEMDAIGQAEWRLRALARQRPGDTAIGVAHLHALLMSGRACEAIEAANGLWALRYSMGPQQFETFCIELAQLGMYERAAELLPICKERTADHVPDPQVAAISIIEFLIAWGLGDLDWISRTAPQNRGWAEFVEQLRALGVGATLSERQRIIRSKTFGKQCRSHLVVSPGTDLPISVTHYCFTAGSYDERVALEEEIQRSLDPLFAPLGLEDRHWGLVSEIIVPVSSGPPLHKDFYNAAA